MLVPLPKTIVSRALSAVVFRLPLATVGPERVTLLVPLPRMMFTLVPSTVGAKVSETGSPMVLRPLPMLMVRLPPIVPWNAVIWFVPFPAV